MDKIEQPLLDILTNLANISAITKVDLAANLIKTQRIAIQILIGKNNDN